MVNKHVRLIEMQRQFTSMVQYKRTNQVMYGVCVLLIINI